MFSSTIDSLQDEEDRIKIQLSFCNFLNNYSRQIQIDHKYLSNKNCFLTKYKGSNK